VSCFWRMVVLVELLYVQAAATVVHVASVCPLHLTVDLDRLCSVSLLGVELSAFSATHGRNHEFVVLLLVVAEHLGIVARSLHDGLPLRVESKVGLVHQLFVERRIDRGKVV